MGAKRWFAVLREVSRRDGEGEEDVVHLFKDPVVETWPQLQVPYSKAIRQPMAITTLETLINEGGVDSDQAFSDLLDLMWLNCWAFNQPEKGKRPTLYQQRALAMQNFACRTLVRNGLPLPTQRNADEVLHKGCWQYPLCAMYPTLPSEGTARRKRSTPTPPPREGAKKQKVPETGEKEVAKPEEKKKKKSPARDQKERRSARGPEAKKKKPKPATKREGKEEGEGREDRKASILPPEVTSILEADAEVLKQEPPLEALHQQVDCLESLLNVDLLRIPQCDTPEQLSVLKTDLKEYIFLLRKLEKERMSEARC